VEVSAEGTELLVLASSELEGVVVPLQPVSAQVANVAAAKQQKNRFNIFFTPPRWGINISFKCQF
jgi:hypothetical protein